MTDPIKQPSLLPALLGYGLGSADWQGALRRSGMPFARPAALRALTAFGGTAAGALLATTVAGAAMASVTGVPRQHLRRSLAPGAAGAFVAFPVLGTGVGAYVEAATAWRCSRAATADLTSAAARTGAGLAVFGLVHGMVSTAVDRLLDAAASPPPRTRATPADTDLNMVGPDVGDTGTGPEGFVVYFDGVGRYDSRTTPVGRGLATAVAERLPRWTVVLSVMPEDVTQQPVWNRPVTGGLWRWLHQVNPTTTLTRGVWEAVVALDPRYRVRLSEEHTRQVIAHLEAAGYRRGSGVPVVLVGLSGGAQTALHVASEVARSLGGAPVDVVTFGAFADGSADLDGVRRVHAVVSWADPAELLTVLLFPSRWTALGIGAWRQAKQNGTVVIRRHDWANHIGRRGYLSPEAHSPDGRTRLAQAADVVATAARQLLGERQRVTSS